MAGILNPSEYMTQKAYIEKVTSLDMFGSPATTSVETFSCLAYQHAFSDPFEAPVANVNYNNWFLLIPSTVAVTVNDHVKQVRNDLGETVIPNAIVKQVMNYDHWEYRSRFRILMLDVSRNG